MSMSKMRLRSRAQLMRWPSLDRLDLALGGGCYLGGRRRLRRQPARPGA
jgi:hypothetical protein